MSFLMTLQVYDNIYFIIIMIIFIILTMHELCTHKNFDSTLLINWLEFKENNGLLKKTK